jgi:hypothetical protein
MGSNLTGVLETAISGGIMLALLGIQWKRRLSLQAARLALAIR